MDSLPECIARQRAQHTLHLQLKRVEPHKVASFNSGRAVPLPPKWSSQHRTRFHGPGLHLELPHVRQQLQRGARLSAGAQRAECGVAADEAQLHLACEAPCSWAVRFLVDVGFGEQQFSKFHSQLGSSTTKPQQAKSKMFPNNNQGFLRFRVPFAPPSS